MSFKFNNWNVAGIIPKNKKWNYKSFNFKILLDKGNSKPEEITPSVEQTFMGVSGNNNGNITIYKLYTDVSYNDGNIHFISTNHTPIYENGNLKI